MEVPYDVHNNTEYYNTVYYNLQKENIEVPL